MITALSMSVGGPLLLAVGLLAEGLPRLTGDSWVIVLWLASVNTAFAFTLWNRTLRTLTAVESSVLNNAMLIEIAVLAWLSLGESLDPSQIAGIVLVAAGVLGVQLGRRLTAPPSPSHRSSPPAGTGA